MYAGPPCRVSETSFISQRLHGRARAPASRLEYLKGSPLQKSNRLECGTIHDQFEVPLKFFLPCRLGRHPCPTLDCWLHNREALYLSHLPHTQPWPISRFFASSHTGSYPMPLFPCLLCFSVCLMGNTGAHQRGIVPMFLPPKDVIEFCDFLLSSDPDPVDLQVQPQLPPRLPGPGPFFCLCCL